MPTYKKPVRGSRQLRKHRYSQAGEVYFITTSCFNKQKVFLKKEVVQIVFDTIDWLEQKKHIECYFAMVMPDHLHIVFQLLDKKTLSEVMKSLKGFTGKRIKECLKITTFAWQEQFRDHLIRDDEGLVEIIKYCLYNPVRAGQVATPLDYPFWTSKFNLGQ
ncbi:MAG: hypothetical protein AMJ92_03395 [candidate division Zixibacteria bacterium SM23_81]|nr:MAG: hypothetical protein AMJ92_03395 [candidate division Zixibacteria bacterium SM23_81]